jgi:hypothetical protein
MTAEKSMKSRKISCFSLLLASLCIANLVSNAVAQGICIPKPLTVAIACGRVVLASKKGEEPLPGAKVELREKGYEGRIIATVAADKDGCFSFSSVPPGKYVLSILYPDLMQFMVRVRVLKAPKAREARCQIVIALGANALEPCGGGTARVTSDLQSCASNQ